MDFMFGGDLRDRLLFAQDLLNDLSLKGSGESSSH
jgi:hypothetical protein